MKNFQNRIRKLEDRLAQVQASLISSEDSAIKIVRHAAEAGDEEGKSMVDVSDKITSFLLAKVPDFDPKGLTGPDLYIYIERTFRRADSHWFQAHEMLQLDILRKAMELTNDENADSSRVPFDADAFWKQWNCPGHQIEEPRHD